ncbi:hypothetical protein [Actinomycetospora aeridis]|uniref:Uncharacterized protein n=1 Tax=Actinomycetospora aeridis TaxID=3129231 RepID=A0ABU8N3Z1_9PSEU
MRGTTGSGARQASWAWLVGRVDELASELKAARQLISAATPEAVADLAERVDALEARTTRQVAAVATLPALVVGTPRDVDAPWDTALTAAPTTARITAVEGTSLALTVAIKAVAATKVTLTVSTPGVLGASVAKVRVLALTTS